MTFELFAFEGRSYDDIAALASRRQRSGPGSCAPARSCASCSPWSAAMAECTHLARTSAYFDGALPIGEEAEALAHLETCAECQAFLRDAATFDAVLSQAPARATASPRRWRWPVTVGAVGVAAPAAASRCGSRCRAPGGAGDRGGDRVAPSARSRPVMTGWRVPPVWPAAR